MFIPWTCPADLIGLNTWGIGSGAVTVGNTFGPWPEAREIVVRVNKASATVSVQPTK
jgi:hypothetical protein